MTEQRWLRILSVSFVMYTIAYIDRTNVSMALPAMSAELHMDPRQAGDAVGLFFWGYLLLQMPAAYLAQHWSAKRTVAILLVAWGLCSVATGFVHTLTQFRLMRLVLGLAEGGVWPAVLVLVAHWFPRAERARANAYWMLCLPLSVVISSPLSGWLLTHWNWRVLLIVEGAFPFLWLLVWLLSIDDFPKQAKWISAEERQYLEKTLAAETADAKPQERVSYLAALLSPQVLILTTIYFLRNFGSYGSLFWLPTALGKAKKLSDLTLGNVITIPYLLAAILMVAAAKSSDRTGERRAHMSLTLIVSGASFLGALVTQRFPFLSFSLISLAVAAVYASLGPFWALPTETLPRKVVATAMGLINAIGNLGGYFGPVVIGHFLKQSGGFVYGFGIVGIALIIAAGMSFMLRPAKPAAVATVSS
ncbi:MAG TPA: MFS transporter [Terriglobales bacterium]|jgi:MFS family permease|nr:MFS transporter [Terriglobales bacterium]